MVIGFGPYKIIQNYSYVLANYGWWNKLLHQDDVDHVLWKHCDENRIVYIYIVYLFSVYIYVYTSIPYQLPGWVCPSRVRQPYQQYTVTPLFLFYLREPQPHGVCPRHPLSPPNDSGIPSVKSVVWGSFWNVPGVWWWSFLECLNNRKSDFGKKMSHMKGIVSPTHPFMTTSFPIVWHFFWLP